MDPSSSASQPQHTITPTVEAPEDLEANPLNGRSTPITSPPRPSLYQLLRTHLSHSLSGWFCPAYLVDWGVVLAAIFLEKFYLTPLKPFQRDLSIYFPNPEYHGTLKPEHISEEWLHHFSVTLPLLVLIILTLLSYPTGGVHLLPTLHLSLLGLLAAHVIARYPTDLLKVWVGRLRPDFFSRCSYSVTTNTCIAHHSNFKLIEKGMKSFPSGHSSEAFSGLGYLALWIAGRNGAFALGGDRLRGSGPWESRLLKGLVAVVWLALASWIAVTRLQDNLHHSTDVLAGGFIGVSSALIAYLLYFPSPFDGNTLGTTMGKPRQVYASASNLRDEDTIAREGVITLPGPEQSIRVHSGSS
ncbi:phosphatidic acid phosphatase type 2/haloperoxidase [Melampsora americana]|nr:phosphatidic acid phosphatase type 2/haloperoxidase [Melampsora americana]